MPETQNQKNTTAGVRTLAVFVFIFGAGSLVYGGMMMRDRLYGPFEQKIPTSVIKQIIPKTEDERVAELKNKDTDKDGLSDYDEVYVYGTSPYLADTDSDGVSDYDEVKRGSDPSCDESKGECAGVKLVMPDTKISDLFPKFSESNISLKDKTLQEFRQILIDQGYPKDKLTQISDATLMLILEESLKLQDQGTTTTTTVLQATDYDKMRLFLIDMGVPKEEVYSLSNKEIEDIYKTFK